MSEVPAKRKPGRPRTRPPKAPAPKKKYVRVGKNRYCGYKLSDGTTCRNKPIKGKTFCGEANHGAASTGATTEEGKLANSEVSSETRLYARWLKPGALKAFNISREVLGTMDEELCLARANLDWAVEQWQENPKGGPTVSQSDGENGSATTIRLWTDLIREHQEIIRRLELVRQSLTSGGGATSRGALFDLLARIKEEEPDADKIEEPKKEAAPSEEERALAMEVPGGDA